MTTDDALPQAGDAPVSLTGRQRFLRACRREPVDRPPIWVMRQAGRYLPEYRELRGQGTFLEAVRTPERATELTLQPIRRFDMDAAVIFSDILVPLTPMGLEVDFVEGQGPVVSPPVRTREDVDRLRCFDPEVETGFLGEAIRGVRSALAEEKAIIGFGGAPFTTASYMIEGRSSKNFENTKGLMHGDPELFSELVEKVVDALIPYLGMQVEAGVDALQIFDSWGGAFDAGTYRRLLFDPMQRLVCAAKALDVPVVLYVNGCLPLIEVIRDLEPDVAGIDWRIDPREARERLGPEMALQGNLDPAALFAGPEASARLARETLEAFGPEPGHIFNLGSGILPKTPVESLQAVVDVVQEWTW